MMKHQGGRRKGKKIRMRIRVRRKIRRRKTMLAIDMR